ncbi:MAG: PH domain-containing protein [Bacteroidetes bacterium]|nr:PH domain-containing protein [Bacteroidota bacterium]
MKNVLFLQHLMQFNVTRKITGKVADKSIEINNFLIDIDHMKIYKLKFDKSSKLSFAILIIGAATFYSALVYFDETKSFFHYLILFPIISFVILIPFIQLKLTKVYTDKNTLNIKIWFHHKSIPLDTIHTIEYNKSWLYSGATMKYSISRNSLIIKYNKYDEILLGIEDTTALIEEIQQINNELRIIKSNS